MPIAVPAPPTPPGTGGGPGSGGGAGPFGPGWLRVRLTCADGFDIDISSKVASVDITRGRSTALDTSVPAATCTVVLDNSDSWFDPDNTQSPLYGHLSTYNTVPWATTPTLRVDHLIVAEGQFYRLFTGGCESLDNTFTPGRAATTSGVFVDSTAEFTRHILPVNTKIAASLPGSRIQDLMGTESRTGFVWTSRTETGVFFDLDTGQKILGQFATDGTTNSWDLATAAAYAELGLLFFNGAGTLVFQGQDARLRPDPDWFMGDQPGLIPVEADLGFRYSTDKMLTDAAVSTTDDVTSLAGMNGVHQTVTDKTTVSADLTDTSQLGSWNAGAAKAQYAYATYSKAQRDAPTVTLNIGPVVGNMGSFTGTPPPYTPPFTPSAPAVGGSAYVAGVKVEIGDLIQITRTPEVGDQSVANYWVEGIHHTIVAGDSWICSLTVSHAPPVATSYWVLGVSTLGVDNTLTW